MGFGELLLLAVGVSMDAFAVSVCKGLAMKKADLKGQLTCGIWFGGFQALMPLIGYFLGSLFADAIVAYEAVVDEMCVGREAKDAFAAMLSDMGRGYLDGELAAIDVAVDKLCASERRVTDDYKNKTRAAGAMIAAVAVGAVILVI